MKTTVMRKEQLEQGYIQPQTNYVPAAPQVHLHDNERGIIQAAVAGAADMVSQRPLSHLVRSDDNAVTQAQGSLLYSVAYALATALITGGLLLLAWVIMGGEGSRYAMLWLVVWGACVLVALAVNRWQGLYHSSTGIAHHEIDSRERLAAYAIEKHVALIEKRWKIEK